MGSKESDWWLEIGCCHKIFKTCHIKSAAVAEFMVTFHINFKFAIVLVFDPKPLAMSRTPFLVKNLPDFCVKY